MKVSGEFCNNTRKNSLKFGGDMNHLADSSISRILAIQGKQAALAEVCAL